MVPDFLQPDLAHAIARELAMSAWDMQNTVEPAEAIEMLAGWNSPAEAARFRPPE